MSPIRRSHRGKALHSRTELYFYPFSLPAIHLYKITLASLYVCLKCLNNVASHAS